MAAVGQQDVVPVPRTLLRQILDDGSCPLHLRNILARLMDDGVPVKHRHFAHVCWGIEHCLTHIAGHLSLADILAVRATSSTSLEWAMVHAAGHEIGILSTVRDRVRVRLWMQRVFELTHGTKDETIFETHVRGFAYDALRRRMEAEMREAKLDMERQIQNFQAEVDFRLEEQAIRVPSIVEERVQQQLDMILANEMERVRALVEERFQGRLRSVVQREVQSTVCEMQVRLAMLARENDRLRTAFFEQLDHSDLCFRSLVWALSPNATGLFARTLRLVWYCQRKVVRFSAWLLGVPPNWGRERSRMRIEEMHALRRLSGEDGSPQRRTMEFQELRALRRRIAEDNAPRCSLSDTQAADVGPVFADALEDLPGATFDTPAASDGSDGSLVADGMLDNSGDAAVAPAVDDAAVELSVQDSSGASVDIPPTCSGSDVGHVADGIFVDAGDATVDPAVRGPLAELSVEAFPFRNVACARSDSGATDQQDDAEPKGRTPLDPAVAYAAVVEEDDAGRMRTEPPSPCSASWCEEEDDIDQSLAESLGPLSGDADNGGDCSGDQGGGRDQASSHRSLRFWKLLWGK
eukprot:TRINITY_DN55532_c0_g1_i1.p1 TRINITY_DN55532_c0_g1~~TRINITY_DN55532_c0_g1_i1.p1  ORF type:complete len:579 (+),score=97.16 TRINITY_DN55532_c0_g1_i1:59-1795(+)